MQHHDKSHSYCSRKHSGKLRWRIQASVTNIWTMPISSCQLVSQPSRLVTAAAVVCVKGRHVQAGLPKTPKSMMQWVMGCPSTTGAEVGPGHGNRTADGVGCVGGPAQKGTAADRWVIADPTLPWPPMNTASLQSFPSSHSGFRCCG